MRNLRRSARRHQAGVDAEDYYAFPVGAKVLTVEGFPGTVTDVEDGPFAGDEQYIVELDGGMGGGAYSSSELSPVDGDETVTAKTATSDEAADWDDSDREDMEGEDFLDPPYAEDDDLVQTAAQVEATGLHVASDDYPELSEILIERPPLAHSERVASAQAAQSIDMTPPLPANWHGPGIYEVDLSGVASTGCVAYYTLAMGMPWPVAWLSWDKATRTVEGVWVMDENRGKGLGAALLDAAAGVAGGPLKDSGEYTPEGLAWAKNRGLNPQMQKSVPTAEMSRMNAQMHDALIGGQRIVRSAVRESVDLGMPQVVEAGFWDRALAPIADHMLKAQDESGHGSYNFETGEMASWDWCRFRHNSHCWFPKTLDAEGTKQAGYAVWTPEDRGSCPWDTFAQQKACPAPSEPGPHSGEPRFKSETWQSWEDGGQRVVHGSKTAVEVDRSVKEIALEQSGNPVADLLDAADPNSPAPQQQAPTSDPQNPYTTGNPYSASLDRREAVWHLTASWKDVQAKAKRIRAEGHVRIISSSPGYLVGQVEGDHGVYQAELTREPGTTRVATWSCGCPWAAYSWGRSGRWAKYEGRMCSHSLALQYEGASRGWHGKEVKEDPHTPAWLRNRKVMVPGDYQPKPIGEWKKSSLVALAGYADILKVALVPGGFQTFDDVADYMLAQISNVEPRVTADLTHVAAEYDGEMEGLEFREKDRDSLLRKLPLKAQSPQALSQPFSTIRDALRYTIAFPEPDWGNSVQKALWALQSKGYKINAEESTWQTGDPYSGLHYDMQAPGSDIVFELQFHTTSSYDLKNKVLHQMYEEFRDSSTPLKRRQDLYDQMSKYWDQIPIPANALDFPNQKVLPRPTSAMHPVSVDPELAQAPVYAMVRDMLSDGDTPSEVLATLVGLGLPDAPGLLTTAMATQPFKARVRGLVTDVLDLLDNHVVKVRGLGNVTDDEVLYPTYNPVRGLTASLHTASADSTGCMVAIEIPRAMAEAIHSDMVSLYGGDAEPVTNYHVTLAYPGDAEDIDTTAFAAAVNDWASRQAPLTGRLSGYGVFHQEGGDKVLYASVDLPGLESAREDLVDTLSRFGIDLPGNHGFTPHLSLAFFSPEQWSGLVSEGAKTDAGRGGRADADAGRAGRGVSGLSSQSVAEAASDQGWRQDDLRLQGGLDAGAWADPARDGRASSVSRREVREAGAPASIDQLGAFGTSRRGATADRVQYSQDPLRSKELSGMGNLPALSGGEYGSLSREESRSSQGLPGIGAWSRIATQGREEVSGHPRVPEEGRSPTAREASAVAGVLPLEMPEEAQESFTVTEVALVEGPDWRHVPFGATRVDPLAAGVDVPWGSLPDGAYDEVLWTGNGLPLEGSPEAAASYVAPVTASKGETVSPSEHGDPRLQDAGVTVAKDDDGYYVRTHRARSDSYDSVSAIPQSDIDYIESTGAVQAEYYTADELRSFWTSPMGGTEGCDICGDSGHTTAEHEAAPQVYDDINRVAELHDVPEPALPTTDGADEDEEQIDDVDDFVPGDPRLAHLMGVSTPQASGGDKDMNIAQAAKAHLAKTALKDFTPAEQKQIIEEGSVEGVVARNLGDLSLEGTHYAVLEEALQAAEAGDDEDSWLY